MRKKRETARFIHPKFIKVLREGSPGKVYCQLWNFHSDKSSFDIPFHFHHSFQIYLSFSIRKIVVTRNIVLAPIIENFHPKNFHYTMCYNFLLLRINRPIKSDRMNLLFYGNVNTLFIKFSAFFLFLFIFYFRRNRILKMKTFSVTFNIKNYENDIKYI